jgi:hypothetical protein
VARVSRPLARELLAALPGPWSVARELLAVVLVTANRELEQLLAVVLVTANRELEQLLAALPGTRPGVQKTAGALAAQALARFHTVNAAQNRIGSPFPGSFKGAPPLFYKTTPLFYDCCTPPHTFCLERDALCQI